MLYAAVQVNDEGKVVAFGRSMQPMAVLQQQLVNAQQSMEREYLRMRQAEARHRLLFQVASEAVLIVDAATFKVLEVNPAAAKLLGEGNRTARRTAVSRGLRCPEHASPCRNCSALCAPPAAPTRLKCDRPTALGSS